MSLGVIFALAVGVMTNATLINPRRSLWRNCVNSLPQPSPRWRASSGSHHLVMGRRCTLDAMSDVDGAPRGTNQHFIPAAYLGRFSESGAGRVRSRTLWAVDRRASRPHRTTAERVARASGLYDLTNTTSRHGGTVDTAWGYESGLPQALDALATDAQPLDGRAWAVNLVPFVAGLFMRGPEFHEEFAERLPASLVTTFLDNQPDHATLARLIDLQVLLTPVMASRWTVMHFPVGSNIVTSDRGYALTTTPEGEDPSYVIPIDPRTALVVTPQMMGAPLVWEDGCWLADVTHVEVAPAEAPALNRAIGAFARNAVYGASADSTVEAAAALAEGPQLQLFPSLDPASHLYDYFRIVCALEGHPVDAVSALRTVDWAIIAKSGWSAPIVCEVLFPDRTMGGVGVVDDRLMIDLTYGTEVRKARKAAGDFRMGALILIEAKDCRVQTG